MELSITKDAKCVDDRIGKREVTKRACKIILSQFEVTELAEDGDSGTRKIVIPSSSLTTGHIYYIRPKLVSEEADRVDIDEWWATSRANKYPVVLDSNGVPWPEANMWLFSVLESKLYLDSSRLLGWADDLSTFLQWIEEYNIDWLKFPSQKLLRPTYRYSGYLKTLINGNKIAASTAKRKMATVIRFYRWLMEQKLIIPQHMPWEERDVSVEFKGHFGNSIIKTVTTTDVTINVSKQIDPYNECIIDDGKLRPLSQQEQGYLLDALKALGNTEMTLIHLFGMVTGARIQTILTFQVQHFLKDPTKINEEWRCPIGPGTFIDTKNNKQMVLHIPRWFYKMVHTYARSDRSKLRRLRAPGGDAANQYLFLSIRGNPLYESKLDKSTSEPNGLKHDRVGKGVRQYIKEYIIPYIRKKYNPNFRYKFHDTRATFGMNLVDDRMKLLADGGTNLNEVMDYVRTRLGHEQQSTTDRYLSYRSRLKLAHAVQDGWEARLENLALQAMGSYE